MLIKVMADSGRRIAWTDRKNGYFQFLFSKKNNENGYFRGNTKFLDGFASFGKGLDESEFTEVFPYGFKSVFKNSFIEAALLLEETGLSLEEILLANKGKKKPLKSTGGYTVFDIKGNLIGFQYYPQRREKNKKGENTYAHRFTAECQLHNRQAL